MRLPWSSQTYAQVRSEANCSGYLHTSQLFGQRCTIECLLLPGLTHPTPWFQRTSSSTSSCSRAPARSTPTAAAPQSAARKGQHRTVQPAGHSEDASAPDQGEQALLLLVNLPRRSWISSVAKRSFSRRSVLTSIFTCSSASSSARSTSTESRARH